MGASGPDDAGAPDTGVSCPSGSPACNGVCCTDAEECVEGACLPACASGLRCGAGLTLCCGADEECKAGACEKKCVPNCLKPGGTGVKECGDDGCGHTCPPGCAMDEVCTPEFNCELPVVTGNDACATAFPLQFVAGTTTLHGDTTGAKQDTFLTCSQQNGFDVVFSFTLTEGKKFHAEAKADDGSALYPVLGIQTRCGSYNSELACALPASQTDPSIIDLPMLGRGTYYLWLVGNVAGAAGAGKFTITVTVGEPDQPPPSNDTCANATALDLTSGSATAAGDLLYANGDDAATTCPNGTDTSGADVVYKFDVPAGGYGVTARLAFDNTTTYNRAGLYLRSGCDASATELACASNARASALAAKNLAAGTYYLFVDSSLAFGEPYQLTVEIGLPPGNDTCANATALDLTSGSATTTGDLIWARDDTAGATCPNGTNTAGGDVVYKFDVLEGNAVSARLAFDSTTTSNRAGLYLRTGCDASATEVACTSYPRSTSLIAKGLAAGTYYLFVDSSSLLGEPYHLTVLTGSAPANDTCTSGAQVLTLDSTTGATTVTGDTTFADATAQGAGNCSGSNLDVVYKLHLDQSKGVTMTVTPPTGSSYQPIVYIRSSCPDPTGSASRSLACGYGTTGNPAATAHVNRLPAGDFYIWVGGWTPSTSGAFTLEVDTADVPIPPNDACDTPTVLQLDATTKTVSVTGSTTYALPEYDPATCQYTQGSGPDLVYKVTLSEAGSLTAKVTPTGTGSAFIPYVYIRSACASSQAADEKACAMGNGAANPSATALMPAADATDYYIIVDGYRGSSGDFTLDVAEGPLVANDTCSNPEEIVISSSTGIGTATGDTSLGKADDYGTCQSSSYNSSSDLTYKFTLAQDSTVTIDVTPAAGSTLKPAMYVRTACDQRTSQVFGGCVAGTTAASTQLVLNVLSAGTYYLWVDGASGTAGAFTVTVTTTAAPAAPASDSCATAQTLNLVATADPATSKATVTGADTTNARNDTQGIGFCAGTIAGDLVYKVTLSATQKLIATATPDSTTPTFQPMVFIRSTCGGSTDADQLACAAGPTAGGAATATANSLAAGDYYVWVDGAASGKFSLEVTATTPVAGPTNDNCSAPTALSFTGTTATATGTTVDAQNDTRSQQFNYGSAGGDVVYSFALTTTDPRRITASVAAGSGAPSGFRPVVILRNQCGAIADLGNPGQGTATTAATTSVASANAGTYFVWVDTGGTTPAPGPFTLTVTVEVPNDQCTNYISLTAGTPQAGDTTNATDQYGTTGGFSAVCATALGTTTDTDGPDLVYRYTTPSTSGNFTITVTPSATFDAIVWVTTGASSCGQPGSCIALADAARSGGVETLSVTGTTRTTYYIIVDSYQPSMAGSFTIEVQ